MKRNGHKKTLSYEWISSDSIKEIMDTTNTVIMLLSAASGKLSNVPTEHSTSFISSEREEKTMALLLWQQRLVPHERKKDHTTYDGDCSATPRAFLFTSDTAVANQVLPPPASGGLDCCDGFTDCGPPALEPMAKAERVLLRGKGCGNGFCGDGACGTDQFCAVDEARLVAVDEARLVAAVSTEALSGEAWNKRVREKKPR